MLDKYSINVFWSEEDECFVATCPEFPLLSAFGDSREEATSEFQIVLEMAIESYQENDLEPPKPKTSVAHSGQFRLRLPKSVHKGLSESAEREGVSLNTYLVSLITENHTLKRVYAEKLDALETIMQRMAGNMISSQEQLQFHRQRLDIIENSTQNNDPVLPMWKSTDEQHYHAVSRACFNMEIK